ncbi:MAG: Na(+)-translocating NADH-quinone reductase subunit A [Bacteroidales bacterium]|jgi:Na+-transporting NADH:ubiquinone oxidoreductase subunit A|nr:Na(+)-translocating NADH-quinone reductase subunit A [Bacteroidales bacterium]
MNNFYNIKKGLDIQIKGKASEIISDNYIDSTFIISPNDFFGFSPKLSVKIDDIVKRGDCLCFDKNMQEIKLTSPVNGKIIDIIRGEKRIIEEIIIEKIENNNAVNYASINPNEYNQQNIKSLLLDSGCWLYIKQRPFATIANPEISPRDIFISFFDSSPLAANYDFILKDKKNEINTALKAISCLCNNKIYLNFRKNSQLIDIIDNHENYNINFFAGPHPAGLAGTHINKIKPINKNEIVWTLNAADLPIIGHLLIYKEYLPERIFALCGPDIKNPCYYKTISNCVIINLLKNKITSDNNRIISGNVLTGKNVSKKPHLKFSDTLITIIPEGNNLQDIFGWIMPGFKKFSFSNTFISKYIKPKKFEITTNLHGGKRAFIISGQYEKVFPLDIFPQLLIKAAIASDIEKMEELGIYEIIEEDLALCEFICTSKINIQEILKSSFKIFLDKN